MSADQWNESGDCTICRRAKFCGKQCKAAGRKEARDNAVLMTAVLTDMLSKTISKSDMSKDKN